MLDLYIKHRIHIDIPVQAREAAGPVGIVLGNHHVLRPYRSDKEKQEKKTDREKPATAASFCQNGVPE